MIVYDLRDIKVTRSMFPVFDRFRWPVRFPLMKDYLKYVAGQIAGVFLYQLRLYHMLFVFVEMFERYSTGCRHPQCREMVQKIVKLPRPYSCMRAANLQLLVRPHFIRDTFRRDLMQETAGEMLLAIIQ